MLDAIIAKEATCENLIPLYKRNFGEFKSDPLWLKRAAINPNSFYGMLSTQILGIKEPINWKNEYLSYNEEKKILALPAIKRIKALIQI